MAGCENPQIASLERKGQNGKADDKDFGSHWNSRDLWFIAFSG